MINDKQIENPSTENNELLETDEFKAELQVLGMKYEAKREKKTSMIMELPVISDAEISCNSSEQNNTNTENIYNEENSNNNNNDVKVNINDTTTTNDYIENNHTYNETWDEENNTVPNSETKINTHKFSNIEMVENKVDNAKEGMSDAIKLAMANSENLEVYIYIISFYLKNFRHLIKRRSFSRKMRRG